MGILIYSLCGVTSLLCAWLLLRSYFASRYRLLLWSGLCFSGLTLNNLFLLVDKVLFIDKDFTTPRLISAFIALLPLLYGLIFEE